MRPDTPRPDALSATCAGQGLLAHARKKAGLVDTSMGSVHHYNQGAIVSRNGLPVKRVCHLIAILGSKLWAKKWMSLWLTSFSLWSIIGDRSAEFSYHYERSAAPPDCGWQQPFLLDPDTAEIRTGRGGSDVSEVKIGDNESFEAALKRFNRKIQQDGILAEARRREHYEKPSVKRKKKEAARKRKARKG